MTTVLPSMLISGTVITRAMAKERAIQVEILRLEIEPWSSIYSHSKSTCHMWMRSDRLSQHDVASGSTGAEMAPIEGLKSIDVHVHMN